MPRDGRTRGSFSAVRTAGNGILFQRRSAEREGPSTASIAEDELERCKPRIPGHLRAKLDVGDLLQEVRARILRAEASFEGRTEPEVRRYIRRTVETVTDETIRRFDQAKRRANREIQLPEALASDHTSPTQRAVRNELLDRLAEALAALPSDQRLAIELKHLEGLSLAATAARMGKTGPAAAGLLRRGLQTVRERLGGDG
jgi:RNA polymerase sigma-70 factor (ECF subfamily)